MNPNPEPHPHPHPHPIDDWLIAASYRSQAPCRRGRGPGRVEAWTKGPATIEAMIKGPHGFAAKATTDHYVLRRNQEFLVSGVSRIRDKKEIPGFRNFSHQRSNLAYNALLTSVQQVTLSWEVQRLSVTRAGAGEPVPNEMAQRPPGRRCSSVA